MDGVHVLFFFVSLRAKFHTFMYFCGKICKTYWKCIFFYKILNTLQNTGKGIKFYLELLSNFYP